MNKRFFTFIFYICFFFTQEAYAKNLGIFHRTYPIVERNSYEELLEKVKSINWKEKINVEKMKERINNYKPSNLYNLPNAKKNREREIDLSYTLDFDITDGRGNIIYYKGYTFNPLQYIYYSKKIYVLNADEPKQIEWIKNQKDLMSINVIIILSNGSYVETQEKLNRNVFYLNSIMGKRLQLEFVPCTIKQNKNHMMTIKEYAL